MRKSLDKNKARNIVLGLAIVSSFALYTPTVMAVAPTAMPTGGSVAAGSAAGLNTNVGTATNPVMNITQDSERAVINWATFNVGKNGTMNYIQTAGPQAAVLNVVAQAGGLSEIAGKINANGSFALYNPNGMIFYKGSEVHTGGFLATTMEVDSAKFMKEYDNPTATEKMMGSVKFKTNANSPNASIVMDGVVTSQMNDARFYDNAPSSSPFAVLGGVKAATTFSPINNKIWLVAEGNVRLGANANLEAITTTAPKRNTPVGEENYNIDTIKMTADGEVKIRTDANLDNFVEKDYTLDYTTDTTAPSYTTKTFTKNTALAPSITNLVAAQIKADAGYKIKSKVSAYEAATIIDDKASVDALTGQTGTGLTYVRKNYNSGTLDTLGYTRLYTNDETGKNEVAKDEAGNPITVAATTAKKYMLINDIYELQAIDPTLNAGGGNLAGYYALGQEIDASDTANWNQGKGFVPIGKNGTAVNDFTGKIYGVTGLMKSKKKDGTTDNPQDGYLPTTPITGLTINLGTTHVGDTSTDYAGLIAINNGTVEAVDISGNVAGDENVGLVAGVNNGALNQVNASGNVQGHEYVGGLAGDNTGSTYLSSMSGTVTAAGDYAGGVFGKSVGGTVGNEVYNHATVTGVNYVGGYVGYADGTAIGGDGWRAGNLGHVVGSGNYIGGVAGYMNNGYIDRVFNGGTVEYTGTASSTVGNYVGGLAGQTNGTTYIDEAFNYGNVKGNENVGGLVGEHNSTGAITSSYNGDTVSVIQNPSVTVTEATFTLDGITYNWDAAAQKFTADKTYNYDSAWVFAAENWSATEIETINDRVDGSFVIDSKGVKYTYDGTSDRWVAVQHLEYNAENPKFNPETGLMEPGRTAAQVLGEALKNDDYYGFTYGSKVYKYDITTKMYTEYDITGQNATGNTYSDEEMTGYTDAAGVHAAIAPVKERVYTVRPTFAQANVSGDKNTGGLVGHMTNGSISNAYNVGKVTDTDAASIKDTGALVGNKTGGTINATNVYWVDDTGRAQADYAYTTNVDYKDNHMSGVTVGIGNTEDIAGKISLADLENTDDVLGGNDKGTLYKSQITPLISSYLQNYTFERDKEYNGLVNSLRTDDVENLYGAGRFDSAEIPGVGKNVLNSATTKDDTGFTQEDGTIKPKEQATDADGNLLYYQTDGTVGTVVTGDKAYWLFERDTAKAFDANGNEVEYEYSKYTFNNSDLWSPQFGYKTSALNHISVKPRPLAVTVHGSHEYGEIAVHGTNPIANVVSPDATKYSIYANILGYNETFENVIVGDLLYRGTDIFTGLTYNENGVIDSNTLNAGTYNFSLGDNNGREDVANGFSGKTALNGNYLLTYRGELIVTKAPLTITIDDQTKVYGDVNPATTGTLTGWKNGENETTATGASGGFYYTVDNPLNPNDLKNVGTYADAIKHNYQFANYETVVNTTNGTLTITKADLVYTANDQNKIYGQLNPDLTTNPDYSDKGSFAGWKGADSYNNAILKGTVSGALSLSTAATQQSDAGTYDIDVNSNLDFTNYNVTYKKGTLTIDKADLEFNAEGQHYMGAPIGLDDFTLTAANVSTSTTTDQVNDGKLKSWDAASATDIKTLSGFHRDGTDDLVLYMIDKNGNRSIISNLTEMNFDADGNIVGYKLLDGSFKRADGTYQLMSKNYILKFKSSDNGNFIVDYPNGPMTAVYNAAASAYNDFNTDRHGTVRYLTIKGNGIKH